MNNRPLSREEMRELIDIFFEIFLTTCTIGQMAKIKALKVNAMNILTPIDNMTPELCAERLAKNNPFEQLEDVNGY